jgi:hypothetical protein
MYALQRNEPLLRYEPEWGPAEIWLAETRRDIGAAHPGS